MDDHMSPQQRDAFARMLAHAPVDQCEAMLAAFVAAPVLPDGTVDAGAALTDFLVRLGHSPAVAAAEVADAFANPMDWRNSLH